MKKIYVLIAAVLLTATVWAQSPNKMSYQAVIRDANNNLTTNQAVGMQISVLQTTATGTAVYVETQTPITNANGLVSLEIGTGTVVNGDFTTIDWANDTYFIKIETDPTGGISYTITGTTQLMSVPYALHSKTAESITGTVNYTETDPIFGASIANGITAIDTANWNNHTVDTDTQLDSTGVASLGFVAGGGSTSSDLFYLGQDTLGGIVYYLYKGATGTQHGLIVSKTESTTAEWQATETLTGADRTEDGAFNTTQMTNSAAATYVTGLGAGWYLPSIDELNRLYNNRAHANKALRAGGFTLLISGFPYWSSTEFDTFNAFSFDFFNAVANITSKRSIRLSRAVRAF